MALMKICVGGFDHEKLRTILDESGLRVDWVARKVGIHKRTLAKFIKGQAKPSLPTLRMIALSLGRTDEDFIKKDSA